MRSPLLIPPRSGEVIGDAPDRRVEILSDVEPLNATWSRFAAGRDGADLHVHRRHSDLFYVLGGELTVRLGLAGEAVAVAAGTLVRIPPLVVHGFRNGGDGEVRYLNLHAPGQRFADYLRARRDGLDFSYDQEDPPPEGTRPIGDVAIGERLGVEETDGARTTLLADVDDVAVAEVELDAGASPPPPPADGRAFDSLYVLDGAVTLHTDGHEQAAAAGTWIQLPAGVPHGLTADGPARCLHVRT